MGSRGTSGITADASTAPLEEGARKRPLGRGSAGPFATLTLALVWLRRSGSFLVPLTLSAFMTAVLLCTVPLYLLLSSDVQLQYLLATTPRPDINIEAQVALGSVAANDANDVETTAQQLGRVYLSGFAPTSMSFLDASTVDFASVNGVPIGNGPNATRPELGTAQGRPLAFDYAQTGPYMRLYSGRLPRDVGPNQMPEVLATPKLNVNVGDVIGLKQIGVANTTVRVRVVGIWFPKNPDDPYWNDHSYDTVNNCGLICPPDIYPLLFTRGGFFQMLAPFQEPSPYFFNTNPYYVNVHEVYFTQPSRMHAADIPATLNNMSFYLHTLTFSTNVPHSVYIVTHLDTLLTSLNRAQAQGALPLYIIVAQVAALIFLFIFTVAALVIEERENILATLKSRGASRTQLIVCFGLIAAVPAALMAAAGALLAPRAAVELILTLDPVAASVVGASYYFAEASPHAAAKPAVLAAALTVLAVVAAAWLATRGGMLAYRQERGRPSRAPIWKRFYLDIILAVICLAGYVELTIFGGFGVRSQLGSTSLSAASADPLQVAAPVLLVLSGTLIALRVFGPVARLFARVAMRGRGVTRMLAFVQASRASGQLTRLTLLITLAVAFSLFSLTYRSALALNTSQRAAYETGGDELVQIDNGVQDTEYIKAAQSRIAVLPGVQANTPVVRAASKLTSDLGNGAVGMLGVDPATFAQVAYCRGDFASQPLLALLQQMRGHEQGAQAGESDHPIWAMVSAAFAANLDVKVGDHVTLVLYAGREGQLTITVGAIVNAFPTMYDSAGIGYVVVDEHDLLSAFANGDIGNLALHGANEYWLRTSGRPGDDAQRARAFHQLQADQLVSSVTDRRTLTQQFQSDPVTVGMVGLLLLGTVLAVLLAGVACFLEAHATANQRLIQFAVMRTLGMTSRQIRAMVLHEHALLYGFGLIGGTVLGLVLSWATLPFLSYSTALQDPATVGVPPYVLSFNPQALSIFFVALLATFAAALLLEAWLANRAGLGRALRIGED